MVYVRPHKRSCAICVPATRPASSRAADCEMQDEKMRERAASPTMGMLNRKYGSGHGVGGVHRFVELCEHTRKHIGKQTVSHLNDLRAEWPDEGIDELTLGNLDETPVGNNTREGWIYEFVFPNGLKYVGQTESWARRMRSHKRGKGNEDGQLIKRAIRKARWCNIQVNVLESIPIGGLGKKERRRLLNTAEVKWIAKLGTLKPGGYNSTPGGDAQPMDDPEVAAWHKHQMQLAMNRPEVRAIKRALWQDPEHRSMMRAARTSSDSWMQARKDCQNTEACLEKRRQTWARKRAAKVENMGVEEGRYFMKRAKAMALRAARQSAKRIADHSDRDPVAETVAFWDKEIAGFEAGLWRTPASSASKREAHITKVSHTSRR